MSNERSRWRLHREERILAGMCDTPGCPRKAAITRRFGSNGPLRERSRCEHCLMLARRNYHRVKARLDNSL